MRVLYHLWLSPRCRAVRIALAEKKLEFTLEIENVWERNVDFLALNPAGDVPVLQQEDPEITVSDWRAICHYLEDLYPSPPLFPKDPIAKAETLRLVAWFDEKFSAEVTENLVGEKVMRRLLSMGTPHSGAIRAGKVNLRTHLDYISWLSDRRNWLAGETLSLADIMAGAQISCIDYVGDVPWEDFPKAKLWYAKLKSRPGFRGILRDHIPGIPPPLYYKDPDF